MTTTATDFAEFHGELRTVAAELLGEQQAVAWPALVDAGWVGLEVSEDLGGAGATFAETAVICEQIGRAAGTTGHLGGAVLAVGALNQLQPCSERDELLRDVAAGARRAAVVLGGLTVDGGTLSGSTEFVADADGTDVLLAVTPGGVTVVPTSALTVRPHPLVDETRRLAAVTAENVPIAGLLAFAGDAHAAVGALQDRAAVAVACDSVGVAAQMLADTVAYVAVRQQFGRPVGSFQAVKHACAGMLVAVEASRRLVDDAVRAVSAGGDAGVPAALAKSYVCSAAVDVAGAAMQLHGGIGYTWESGIHVHLKRATLNRSLFGSPADHRRRLAQRYPTTPKRT